MRRGATSGAAPAQAADGAAVLQGTDNGPTTARTMVFTANRAESASLADPNTSGKGSLGVCGHGQNIGVLGDSTGTGTGVQGNGGPDHKHDSLPWPIYLHEQHGRAHGMP